MRKKHLARARMNLGAPALRKCRIASRVIRVGDIFFTPLPWLYTREARSEGGTHDFLRPLPDDEGRRAGIEFEHRNTEDKTM